MKFILGWKRNAVNKRKGRRRAKFQSLNGVVKRGSLKVIIIT